MMALNKRAIVTWEIFPIDIISENNIETCLDLASACFTLGCLDLVGLYQVDRN